MSDLFSKRPIQSMTLKDREKFDDIEIDSHQEPIRVHKSTECHVTPDWVADQMVEYLLPHSRHDILEPSAGTGQLLRALIRGGANQSGMTFVEKDLSLFEMLTNEFDLSRMGATNDDFLNPDLFINRFTYDRVIMNPPFKKVHQHVRKAHRLLADGGLIIALVPSNFKSHLFENCDELMELDSETFEATKVTTKVIRILK